VKSEKDKKEFLKACRHIHDFSVFFNKKKKITQVVDHFRDEEEDIKLRDISDKNICGITLNLDDYPFLNFLACLYDTDYPEVRDKYIIVKKPSKRRL